MQFKQALELFLYIFVKHVIFSKVPNYRWQACNFVSKNLKRAILQNPYQKTPKVESALN